MKKKFRLLFVILIFVSACSKFYRKEGKKSEKLTDTSVIHIDKDLTLKGDVQIIGIMQVERGAKLVILPGTKIEFAKIDKNNDGIGESGLIIYGDMIAEGKPDEPIIFTSACTVKNMNDWRGVYVEGSQNSIFKNCIFEYGEKVLHIHSSPIIISKCEMRFNQGGLHFRDSNLMIDRNYIHKNTIGLRIWDSMPIITLNTIKDNQTGIFCAEGVIKAFIQNNNICENSEYNIALGELQDNVNAQNNYWGTNKPADIEKKIFDQKKSEYIGKAIYSPFLMDFVDINKIK